MTSVHGLLDGLCLLGETLRLLTVVPGWCRRIVAVYSGKARKSLSCAWLVLIEGVDRVSVPLGGHSQELLLGLILIVAVKQNSNPTVVAPLLDVLVLLFFDQLIDLSILKTLGAILFDPVRHLVHQTIQQISSSVEIQLTFS